MKHDGIDIPTHEEVAQVLDGTHPEVAEFIRGVNTDHNCWGDMLFMVQRDFPPGVVAQVIMHLNVRGWGPFIAETFCPYEGEIIKLFEEGKKEADALLKMSFWERTKYYIKRQKEAGQTFACADVLTSEKVLPASKAVRQRWMLKRNLLSYREPKFVDEIIKYLKEKGENKCEK